MRRKEYMAGASPWGIVWLLLAAAGMCGCGKLGKPSEPLRTVAGITQLREGELDSGRRVALRGVITLLDPSWQLLAFEDEGGGVLIEWPALPANLRVGDRVEVTGATSVDNHVPSVVAASLRVVGTGALPRPQPVSADSLACGSDLYRFVEVEIKPDEGSLGDDVHTAHFAVQRPCGRLEVVGRLFRQYAPASLVGRRLRVRGVPLAFYSPAGTIDHVRLMFEDESAVDVLDLPVNLSALTAARSGVLPEIRSVKAVKELPNAEAGRSYPVRAEGVVTALNPRFDGYMLQDGSTGIFVALSRTQGSMPRAGQRVRLSGVTERGGFAPIIRQVSLEVLGTAPLPEPLNVEPGDIFHGWEENRWVELEGVGTAVITDGHTHQLELFSGPRRVLVWFSEGDSPDRLQPLVNARVAVRGVYSPLFTAAGELSGFRIFTISPEMVKVLDPPEAVCDSRTIASLSQFDVRGAPRRRFQTAGVVTYRDTRGRLYLQDGNTALRVIGNGPGDPPLSTWATAEGFLSPDSAAPQMEHVRWLSAKPGSPAAPARPVAESLVSGNLDGRLVVVEGFLESRRTSTGELQLSLLAGRLRFGATMEAPGSRGDFPHLRPGALLRLTGVCATQPSSSFAGTRLATLALRDANDIVLLRRAPWWDLERAAYAAFAASLLLIAVLAVVVLLARNLKKSVFQSQGAERKIKALSGRLMNAQEEERARIARELHDDLSQQIAALSIAMGNLKRHIPEEQADARAQGDLIHQKLVQVSETVRRISHELHPAILQYSGLAVALQSYCHEFEALTGVKVSLTIEGEFECVPSGAALCIYRITQEALQNVAKHANVATAAVELRHAHRVSSLIVSDTGVGIKPGKAGAADGLGLVSIEERTRLVGGSVEITSKPSQGTTITVRVPDSQ